MLKYSKAATDDMNNIACSITSLVVGLRGGLCSLKEVFIDSNNIILWHETEDINKKNVYFQISNFTFSSYVWLCGFRCTHRLLC